MGNDTRAARNVTDRGARPIPCPNCEDVRFERVAGGRRCWACGHTWNPRGHVGETPPPERDRPRALPSARRTDGEGVGASLLPSDPRAAVLVTDGLVLPGGRLVPVDVADAPSVLTQAATLGIRQVWIGPDAARRLHFPSRFIVPRRHQAERYKYGVPHPWAERAQAAGWLSSSSPPGLAPWVGFRLAEDRWVDVVVPSWDTDNPFGGAGSVAELLDALRLYAELLGVRYRRAPGTTGLALMRAVHSGPRAIPWDDAASPAPPAVAGLDSEAPAAWLAEEIPVTGHLHCWDLNGHYLAACSSIELGFGEPEHLRADRISPALHGLPAYHLATVEAPRVDHSPLPFLADGSPHWYTTPALLLLAELPLSFNTRELWVHREHHRWLSPWYVRLRDARRALLALEGPAAALALRAVKATYTRALGRLAGRWLQAGEETFRPDWRDAVIDRARANMHRHLVRVQRISGRAPIAVNADAVVYASSWGDPREAAAELGLQTDPEQLGKWKHAGSLPAADGRDLVTGQPSRDAALSDLLKAMGAE